jgi:hypothetical protein
MEWLFVGLLVALFAAPPLLCLVDRVRGASYSCRIFGWHNGKGDGKQFFDGCSMHAQCSKCGKEVMMDSQGNWF